MPQESTPARGIQLPSRQLTFETVARELRRRSFGIISTVAKNGRSQSTGVCYGVSAPNGPFDIYVMSEPTTVKARNIRSNPNVSFVVPFQRPVLTMVPPACVQFQGRAELLGPDDGEGVRAFQSSYLLRMLLRQSREFESSGKHSTCFIRITPDPVIQTYGVGMSILDLRRHIADASSHVLVPRQLRRNSPG